LLVSYEAFCLGLETLAFEGGTFAAIGPLLGEIVSLGLIPLLISDEAFCFGLETSTFEGWTFDAIGPFSIDPELLIVAI